MKLKSVATKLDKIEEAYAALERRNKALEALVGVDTPAKIYALTERAEAAEKALKTEKEDSAFFHDAVWRSEQEAKEFVVAFLGYKVKRSKKYGIVAEDVDGEGADEIKYLTLVVDLCQRIADAREAFEKIMMGHDTIHNPNGAVKEIRDLLPERTKPRRAKPAVKK